MNTLPDASQLLNISKTVQADAQADLREQSIKAIAEIETEIRDAAFHGFTAVDFATSRIPDPVIRRGFIVELQMKGYQVETVDIPIEAVYGDYELRTTVCWEPVRKVGFLQKLWHNLTK
jgi:hypothetical protein